MAPDQLVNAWSPRAAYEADAPVILKARVRGRDLQPQENAVVEAVLGYPESVRREQPDGTVTEEKSATVRLQPVPLSLGEYQASWRPPVGGLYTAVVTARMEVDELGTDRFEFVAGEETDEFDRVDVDESTLRNLAGRTGGTFHSLATASRLPQELEERRTLVVRRREINLWNAPWLFTAFLACVTAEWILRKRRNLN